MYCHSGRRAKWPWFKNPAIIWLKWQHFLVWWSRQAKGRLCIATELWERYDIQRAARERHSLAWHLAVCCFSSPKTEFIDLMLKVIKTQLNSCWNNFILIVVPDWLLEIISFPWKGDSCHGKGSSTNCKFQYLVKPASDEILSSKKLEENAKRRERWTNTSSAATDLWVFCGGTMLM